MKIWKNSRGNFRNLFWGVFALFFCEIVNAQESSPAPSPSPNASGLGGVANYSVANFSGVPSINIPIYNLQSKDISVPISVSYNASGIKVNDIASWVGLGWNLNAGGVITRVVKDLRDDEIFSGPIDGSSLLSNSYGWLPLPDYTYPSYLNSISPGNLVDALNTSGDEVAQKDYLGKYTGSQYGESGVPTIDKEPDVFYANFNGRNIQFLFDKNGSVRTIPFQDVKITYYRRVTNNNGTITVSPIKKFLLTDELGYVYEFGDGIEDDVPDNFVEYSATVGQDGRFDFFYNSDHPAGAFVSNSDSHMPVAWYLKKITSPNNDEVDFSYTPGTLNPSTSNGLLYYDNNSSETCRNCPADQVVYSNTDDKEQYYNYTYTNNVDRIRIEKIESKNQQIIFIDEDNEREDFNNDFALKSIAIYGKQNGTINTVPIKTFDFSYDYIVSDAESGVNSTTSSGNIFMRLKLTSIIEKVGTTSKSPYEFTYIESIAVNSQTLKLPHRNSKEQDLFGYFNNNGAKHLFPKLYVYPELEGIDRFRWFRKAGYPEANITTGTTGRQYILEGADRATNSQTILLGTIQTIKYPTGGTSTFEFEAKDYLYEGVNVLGGGIRLKKVTTSDGLTNTGDDIVKEYSYQDKNDATKSSGRLNGLPIFAYVETANNFAAHNYTIINGVQTLQTPTSPTVEIDNYLNQTIPPYEYFKYFTVKTTHSFNGLGYEDGPAVGYRYISEIIPNSGKTLYKYYVPDFNDCLPGGGTGSETDETCGTPFEFSETKRIRYGREICHCDPSCFSYCPGCSCVYNITFMDLNFSNSLPFAPNLNYNWSRGLLLSTNIYNANNAIVAKTENEYQTISPAENPVYISGLRYKLSQNRGLTTSASNVDVQFEDFVIVYSKYKIITDVIKKLSKATSTIYDFNGTNPVTTIQDFGYNSLGYLKTTSTTNSDGTVYKSYRNYPLDIIPLNVNIVNDNIAKALKKMAFDKHIRGAVVENIQTKNQNGTEKVISGSLTEYGIDEDDIILPKKFYSLEFPNSEPIIYSNFTNAQLGYDHDNGTDYYYNFIKDSRYHEEASIDAYNVNHLPLTSHSNYDNPVSVQYDNGSDLPIAVFENARYVPNAIGDECSFTGFELSDNDSWLASNITSTESHTGNHSLEIQTGYQADLKSFVPTTQKQKYKWSAWVRTGNSFGSNKGTLTVYVYGTSTNSSVNFSSTNGKWKYIEMVVDPTSEYNGTLLTLKCKVHNQDPTYSFFIDDIRFQPYNSVMNTVNYDENLEVTSLSDENNIPSFIDYDAFYRPKYLKDKDRNMLSMFQYNDASSLSITNLNSVTSTGVLVEGALSAGDVNNLSSGEKIISKNLMDGLGRNIQSVIKDFSPTHKDLMNLSFYDQYGMQPTSALPITINNGDNYNQMFGLYLQAFYANTSPSSTIPVSQYAFGSAKFESSPLRRPLEANAPGEDWRMAGGKTSKVKNRGNFANEVLYWKNISGAFNAQTSSTTSRFYDVGELITNEGIDENGHVQISYSDKAGRLICSALQKNNVTNPIPGSADFNYSYYIYDDFDRPIYSIPPAAMEEMDALGSNKYVLTSTIIDAWLTTSVYDYRHRLIETKMPEKETEYFVYDRLDRIKLAQDGNLRTGNSGKWRYVKYDVLGRPIENGIQSLTHSETVNGLPVNVPYTRNELQTTSDLFTNYVDEYNELMLYETRAPDGTHAHNGYTNNKSYPTNNDVGLLTVAYYDDYDYNNDGTNDANYISDADFSSNSPYSYITGKFTGVKTRNISSANAIETDWYYSYPFYDDKDRVIQAVSDLHIGVQEMFNAQYDFSGKTLMTKTEQQLSTPLVIRKYYTYDHFQRLKTISQEINSDSRIEIAHYNYNELGQMVEKNLHSVAGANSYLQSVDYRYNIRGWLTKINESVCTDNLCAVPSHWLDGFVIHPTNPFNWVDTYINVNDNPGLPPMWNPHNEARRCAVNLMGVLAETEGFTDQDFMSYSFEKSDSAAKVALVDSKYTDSMLVNTHDSIPVPSGEFRYYLKPIMLYAESLNPDNEIIHNTGYAGKLFGHVKDFINDKAGISYDSLIALTNYTGGNYYLDIKTKYQNKLADTALHVSWRIFADSIALEITALLKQVGISESNFRKYAYRMDSTNRVQAYVMYEGEPLFDNILIKDYLYLLLRGNTEQFLASSDSACLHNNALGIYKAALETDTAFLSLLRNNVVNYDSLQIALYDSIRLDSNYAHKLKFYRQYLPSGLNSLLNQQFNSYLSALIEQKTVAERKNIIDRFEQTYSASTYNYRNYINSAFKQQFVSDVTNYLAPLLQNLSAKHRNSTERKNAIEKALRSYLTTLRNRHCQTGENDQNADLFAMELHYAEPNTLVNAPAQYNGNISWAKWVVAGEKERAYGYSYDVQNRLTKASFGWRNMSCKWEVPTDQRYSMPTASYDANGNIQSMKQYGVTQFTGGNYTFGLMDDLTYHYTGNKLTAINDAGSAGIAGDFTDGSSANSGEYSYDANGNMISDANKGLTIEYNLLDQPSRITNTAGDVIEYVYNSGGEKLREKITPITGSVTIKDYIDGALYNTTIVSGDEVHDLDFFFTEEGRVTKQQSGFQYEYSIDDHLGNSRVNFTDANNDGVPELIQRNDYYPYGLQHAGLYTPVVGNKNMYMFNGKELQQSLGLNWADHGYRRYDPQIGRWHATDLLSNGIESPFSAFYNNPISFGDYNGAQPSGGPGGKKIGNPTTNVQDWTQQGYWNRTGVGANTGSQSSGQQCPNLGGSSSGGPMETSDPTAGFDIGSSTFFGTMNNNGIGEAYAELARNPFVPGHMGGLDFKYSNVSSGFGSQGGSAPDVNKASAPNFSSTNNSMLGTELWSGITTLKNARVRYDYNIDISRFSEDNPMNRLLRKEMKFTYRPLTPQPYRALLDALRPLRKESAGGGSPWKASWKYNFGTGMLAVGGTLFTIHGAIQSMKNVASAKDPGKQVLTESSRWFYAYQAGTYGAELGGMYGGFWGALGGGLLGSFGGGIFGEKIMPYLLPDLAPKNKVGISHWVDMGVCFKYGTLVKKANSFVAIENLQLNDSVASYNFVTNKIEFDVVVNKYHFIVPSIYKITIDSIFIYVTAEHPFFVISEGWKTTKDLRKDDTLKGIHHNEIITKVETIDSITDVYNIEVGKNHNYFVSYDEILVHNKNIKTEKMKDLEKIREAYYLELSQIIKSHNKDVTDVRDINVEGCYSFEPKNYDALITLLKGNKFIEAKEMYSLKVKKFEDLTAISFIDQAGLKRIAIFYDSDDLWQDPILKELFIVAK